MKHFLVEFLVLSPVFFAATKISVHFCKDSFKNIKSNGIDRYLLEYFIMLILLALPMLLFVLSSRFPIEEP